MIKKLLSSIRYRLAIINPVKYAKRIGVRVGDDCLFIGVPNFGSEPYLISLGNHVEISNNVQFVTHDGGNWVIRGRNKGQRVLSFRPIKVGNNVFIGARTLILGGVTIGDNVVIGAGSVVTKSIPSNCVACGIPAHPIKSIDEYEKTLLDKEPEYDAESYRLNRTKEIMRMCGVLNPDKNHTSE